MYLEIVVFLCHPLRMALTLLQTLLELASRRGGIRKVKTNIGQVFGELLVLPPEPALHSFAVDKQVLERPWISDWELGSKGLETASEGGN